MVDTGLLRSFQQENEAWFDIPAHLFFHHVLKNMQVPDGPLPETENFVGSTAKRDQDCSITATLLNDDRPLIIMPSA